MKENKPDCINCLDSELYLLNGKLIDCPFFRSKKDFQWLEKLNIPLIDSLISIATYNGLNTLISEWAELPADKNNHIIPNYYQKDYSEALKSQLQIYWAICVLLFGNYGSSPRSGWIENIKHFKQFCTMFKEKE